MRRTDRQMSEEFAWQVADKCEWAVLSMVDPEGRPYCVPVSIARDGRAVYFHCALEGFKTECLKANHQVCISCVGDTKRLPEEYTTEYESATLRGNAAQVDDDAEKLHALRLICLRHAGTNMDRFDAAAARSMAGTAVWRIDIAAVTGKSRRPKP